MPLGQPYILTNQEACDRAQYIDSQKRPQDLRCSGLARQLDSG